MKGWKLMLHANSNPKRAGMAVLISDKQTLNQKFTKDNEGHYIFIKDSIQQENI